MFPSPIAFYLGSWPVKWYGLAYGAGIFLAWIYGRLCLKKRQFPLLPDLCLDPFINIALIGIILGGRLGHIMLYQPAYYFNRPQEIFCLWCGGMAFHGGFLGVIIAAWIYTKREHLSFLSFLDLLSCLTPIGLFLGRLANFINQEVYGIPTDSPLGIIFPQVDHVKRHPSQLYEAVSEGLLLMLVLNMLLWKTKSAHYPGRLTALFLILYGFARCVCEHFRMPEGMFWHMSTGRWYTFPIVIGGMYLFFKSRKST